jgi:hypothetical protein
MDALYTTHWRTALRLFAMSVNMFGTAMPQSAVSRAYALRAFQPPE